MRYAWAATAALVMAALLIGCAAPVKPKPREINSPVRGEGQAAVFGRAYVVEDILGFHPIESQTATVYIRDESDGTVFKFDTNDNGDFGLYLNPGRYRLLMAQYPEYRFIPNVWFTVPKDTDLLYIGAIVFDDTPTGIVRESELGEWLVMAGAREGKVSQADLDYQVDRKDLADTKFIYSVKDESKDFLFTVRTTSPGLEKSVKVKLMESEGAVAIGKYDDKVLRAKDITAKLEAESNAFEEIFGGIITVLPYAANPIWLLSPAW